MAPKVGRVLGQTSTDLNKIVSEGLNGSNVQLGQGGNELNLGEVAGAQAAQQQPAQGVPSSTAQANETLAQPESSQAFDHAAEDTSMRQNTTETYRKANASFKATTSSVSPSAAGNNEQTASTMSAAGMPASNIESSTGYNHEGAPVENKEPEPHAGSVHDLFTDLDESNIVTSGNIIDYVSEEETELYIESQGRAVVKESRRKEAEAAEKEQDAKAKELKTQAAEDQDSPQPAPEKQTPYVDTFNAPARSRADSVEDVEAPDKVFRGRIDSEKQAAKNEVANKQWDGNSFTEKVVASRAVDPEAVSVGSSIILEMIREPGNALVPIVNAVAKTEYTVDELIIDESRFREFINTINSIDLYVVATKSPVQQPSSTQMRILRVHSGRGVLVHPTQVKSYNADFDGDGVSISISSKEDMSVFRTAMDYMVDIDQSHSIDLDFWPFIMLGNGDIHSFRKEFYNLYLVGIKNRIDRKPIADALYKLYSAYAHNMDPANKGNEIDLDPLAYDLVMAMDEQASRYSSRDEFLSYMIKDLYDTSNAIKEIALAREYAVSSEVMLDQMETPADNYIYMKIDEMAAGVLPPNFQDFLIGLHRYVGEIPGKNVVFRLGADVAKRIKFSSQTVVGEEGAWELYQHTLEAGMAMYMSNRASIGEQAGHVQQIARAYVIGKVGYPSDYDSAPEFLLAFAKAWNYFMGMLNASKTNFDMMVMPIKDDNFGRNNQDRYNLPIEVRDGVERVPPKASLRDFSKAMKSIYGKYSIGKVFGKHTGYAKSFTYGRHNKGRSILKKYQSYTVAKFCRCNNIDAYEAPDTVVSYDKDGKQHIVEPFDLLLLLADQRTSIASKFNKDLEALLREMKKGFAGYIRKYETRFENPADYEAYTHSLCEAMFLAGSDMYEYYGMDDAQNFLNSKWGKLFRDAATRGDGPVRRSYASIMERENKKSEDKRRDRNEVADEARADAFGGIRAAMVVEYRLRRIDKLNRAIDSILRKKDDLTQADLRKINIIQNRIAAELNTLGASSDLWKVLVLEISGQASSFQELCASKGKIEHAFIDAGWFWESQPDNIAEAKYKTLLDVLLDPDLSKSEKDAIAVDVVRQHTGYRNYKSYEMAYQLEIGPSSNHTSISTMAYRDDPDILDDIQESVNSLQQFFKENWESIHDDVVLARSLSKDGDLDRYLEDLAQDPQLFLEVGDDMIVDAIDAQMGKTSKSAEKAHQEIPVNWLYEAMSLQKGGYVNAMYRSSDRALGRMSSLTVSSYDLIQVLADPELEIEMYDGKNRWTLSRENLCGGNTEQDVWNMLEANPRIAAMIRPGVASSLDSKSRRGAVHSYKSTLADAMFDIKYQTNEDGVREIESAPARRARNSMSGISTETFGGMVKTYLCDRPMFLSLVAMLRPNTGQTQTGARPNTKRNLYLVQSILIDAAAHGKLDAKTLLAKKACGGITIASLKKAAPNMDDAAIEEWYNEIVSSVNEYLADISAFIREGGYMSEAVSCAKSLKQQADQVKGAGKYLAFDASSIELAIDVHQTMTGAKTEKSTSIEGGMTQLNTGLGLYAMSVQDRHMIINDDDEQSVLDDYAGCMTNAGEVFDGTSEGVAKLRKMLPQGTPLVVEVTTPGFKKEDETLDHHGWQVPSISRFALVKRTKASEKYNLKVKKSGNDGLDSIVKVDYAGSREFLPGYRYADKDSGRNNVGLVESEYRSNGLFAAKMKLAAIMQAADAAEGYTDMDLADYADIASAMIVETVDENDNPTISIRTLEEISLAIRTGMSYKTVNKGKSNEIIDEAAAIASNVGVAPKADPQKARSLSLSLMSMISRSSITSKRGKPVLFDAMSSDERSFVQMHQVMEPEHVTVPGLGSFDKSRKGIASKEARRRQNEKIRAKRHKNDKGKMVPIPAKYAPNGIDVLGYIGSNGTDVMVSPGPTTVWYLDRGASQKAIDGAIARCYAYGMTLVFPDLDCLGDKRDLFEGDATNASWGEYGTGDLQLPFYHMRMNGMADPDVAMAPASFQYDPSWFWFMVEDSENIYALGDSEALTSKHGAGRVQCVAADRLSINIDDLFFNTRNAYGSRCSMPRLATHEEIEKYIVEWQDDDVAIDIGITPDNPYFQRTLDKLRIQIAEYRRDFDKTDDDFGIMPESKPDRITNWVVMKVDGIRNPVFAPIIPWPTGSALTAPTKFSIDGIDISPDTDTIDLDWRITESVIGQFAKIHDGFGGAGKSVTMFDGVTDLGKLKSGHFIDMVIAAASFASRRLAWGKRMCTLKTMAQMMAMPPFGYNYAEHIDAFPDNPEIKERLATERIPIDEWPDLIKGIKRFSSKPDIDTMLRSLVELAIATGTTNPSDILATKYGDEFSFMYVDYDFFFDPSIEFQNTLMKWYNSMQPNICPPSIEEYNNGGESGYLFRPLTEGDRGYVDDYDYGCMQMAVPGIDPENPGRMYYHWENVYLSMSYFNEDYSGLHKPGLNGAHRSMEQNNAIALSGRGLPSSQMRAYARSATAIGSRTYAPFDVEWSSESYGRHMS